MSDAFLFAPKSGVNLGHTIPRSLSRLILDSRRAEIFLFLSSSLVRATATTITQIFLA
jgi:hypothetical protein